MCVEGDTLRARKTGGQKSKMRMEKQRQKVKLMKSKENKGKYLKSGEKEVKAVTVRAEKSQSRAKQ